MKSSLWLTGCLVGALGLSTTSVAMGGSTLGTAAVQALGAVAQADASGDAKARSDELLRQARAAMREGKLELAEQYVRQAEQLNVRYDNLFSRWADTPAKVRADLEKMRPAVEPGRTDPFVQRTSAETPISGEPAAQAGAPQALRLPPVSDDSTIPLPGNGGSRYGEPAASNAGNSRSSEGSRYGEVPSGSSNELSEYYSALVMARKALAEGNATEAERYVVISREMRVLPKLGGDSTERVAALLQQHREWETTNLRRTDPVRFQQEYAAFLLEQAEGLFRHGEPGWNAAQQLAERAKLVNGGDGREAEQLLNRIAAARGGKPAAQGEGERNNLPSQTAGGSDPRVQQGLQLVSEAQTALNRGRLDEAERLAGEAHALRLPDSAYQAVGKRPWELLLQVGHERARSNGVTQAGGVGRIGDSEKEPYPVSQGVYDPDRDTTRTQAAQAQQPSPGAPPRVDTAGGSRGAALFRDGLQMLAEDRARALELFREAWRFRDELDPGTRAALQEKLVLLQSTPATPPADRPLTPIEEVQTQHQLAYQALIREITAETAEVERMVADDPRAGLNRLQALRDRVAKADVAPETRQRLVTNLDRRIADLDRFIDLNRGAIDNNERNRTVRAEVEHQREYKLEVQNKLAQLVEEFNKLIDQQRYAEAEIVAKRARELNPDDPIVQNLVWVSRTIRRVQWEKEHGERKEEGFVAAMQSAAQSSEPFDDRVPFQFGDARQWQDLTLSRRRILERNSRQLSAGEIQIQKALRDKVEVRFSNQPLAVVVDALAGMTGVNIYLDPQGMAAEGVTSDTPVTLNLREPISMESALRLILPPLGLDYVIQHEVLRITSENVRSADTYPEVYYVADLVIPIPNFIPSYNIGLPGAIAAAHNSLGYGGFNNAGGSVPLTVAQNNGGAGGTNASVLAQMASAGVIPMQNGRGNQSIGAGPGGLGGGAQADFDTLIELITSTIAPQSWDEVGGHGSIAGFDTNLSLVVSQTQEVHEQIADLLDQLRRLQDLQVTIEVRFITLQDNFFERIGIDFDFAIDSNVTPPVNIGSNNGPSQVIGWEGDSSGGTQPTADLQLELDQRHFGAAVPQFGGFDATTAANFGFAILSDIEVFFLLQAAQGDSRTNVLQAPKVTLFNGQQAFVSDTSQRPFVTSVIPVVGDFAVGHQPVVVVLSEGTSLSVQAVVSNDRRFVRLTLVPFFSRIGDVEEFTFNGRTTTNTGTTAADPTNPGRNVTNGAQTVTEGTTVQLPTFAFTTVTTTVSVPDGGTVLLGGIKRLSEGRNERGLPLLSKLPYVNRLFKNVGIGRTTSSLMMMVTPRIIIQEEEEEKLGLDLVP